MQRSTPTSQTYDELQLAFTYFNKTLFNSQLPPCLITLQRKRRTHGYFSAERFVNRNKEFTDEIAINPAFFATTPIKDVLSTIVHEMVHQWQFHLGSPGRGRYHNKEWARKMYLIGLRASNTGQPGGRETGDSMDHYIIEGGAFDVACDTLVHKDFVLSWLDRISEINPGMLDVTDFEDIDKLGVLIDLPEGEGKTNRYKYSHVCDGNKVLNAWGKPGLNLICGICGQNYTAIEG